MSAATWNKTKNQWGEKNKRMRLDAHLDDNQLLTNGISYHNTSVSCVSDRRDVEIQAKEKANNNKAETHRENAICRSTAN
jgi:hypothetical protein